MLSGNEEKMSKRGTMRTFAGAIGGGLIERSTAAIAEQPSRASGIVEQLAMLSGVLEEQDKELTALAEKLAPITAAPAQPPDKGELDLCPSGTKVGAVINECICRIAHTNTCLRMIRNLVEL